MSIRPMAVQWLKKAHGVTDGIVCASKFYVPDESRTKKSAWWIEVDRSKIFMSPSQIIHFVCEKGPGSSDFHYLRLPGSYLIENQSKLDVRHDNNRFSIFLSAEQENLFQDERGDGKVTFGQFLV
jgi:hypothetical protein